MPGTASPGRCSHLQQLGRPPQLGLETQGGRIAGKQHVVHAALLDVAHQDRQHLLGLAKTTSSAQPRRLNQLVRRLLNQSLPLPTQRGSRDVNIAKMGKPDHDSSGVVVEIAASVRSRPTG